MGMVEYAFNKHKQHHLQYDIQLEQVQQKRQEMQQVLSQEPEDQQQAQQQQELRMQMPYINAELAAMEASTKNRQVITKNNIDDAEEFFNYDAKDIVEMIAQNLGKVIYQANSFKEESNRAFTSKIVTGKEFYLVDHKAGDKNVTMRAVSELDVSYPAIDSIRWTHEGPWVSLKERWSSSDVIRIYGHLLTDKDIDEIKANRYAGGDHPVFASTGPSANNPEGNGALLIQGGGFGYSGTPDNGVVEVVHVWYKEEKKLHARVTPNRHNPSRPHIHFVDEEDMEKGKNLRKDRGEKLETRYLQERHYGIILNGHIYLGFEKDQIQPRDSNNLSRVYLPIVGRTNASIAEQPYSLIQATKDLNELYQVINYHRELNIAISGVKGQIIDISQKPTDMSLAEQRYHEKGGHLYIQTKTKTGRNVGSNYNQWKGYDNTISNSIGLLDSMLDSIDQNLGILMGVPRQRVGQTISTDQVGSNEQAVHMANLVTELLHIEHDQTDAKAMEMAINIHLNNLIKPGDFITVPLDDGGGNEIFKIPKIDTKNSQISIHVEDSGKHIRLKEELKAAASAGYSRGEIDFRSLLKIYTFDSVKQLEKKLEYFNQKNLELTNNSAMSAEQAEQEKTRLANEVEMALKQEETKIAQAKIEFDHLKLNTDTSVEEKKMANERYLKMLELGTEREVEATYLQEQNRASTEDEKIALLRLQLDAMIQSSQLRLNEKQGDQKHIEGMKKATDTQSGKKANKEKIKDK